MTTDHAAARDTTLTRDFDPETLDMAAAMEAAPSLVTGEVLTELADADDRICVLTADLGRPTRVQSFADRHSDRFHNFGIAERSMIGAAAGMASVGMRPYVAGFASFLAILATEQLKVDVCYPDMPVRLLGTHSGIAAGTYGTTHHATEDIGILRALPNMTVLAPIDGASLAAALRATTGYDHPLYFRLSAGKDTEVYAGGCERHLADWRVGGSARLRDGDAATVLATGTTVAAALEAAEQLAGDGVETTVVDMYSLKPIDTDAVLAAARAGGPVLTVEEGGPNGGLGSAVADVIVEHGLAARLRKISLPDEYSLLGPSQHLYHHYGLDAEGIRTSLLTDLRTQ